MNKSLRTFSIMQKIDLAKTINGLVHFVRQIPFLGKFLGDKYRFYEFKQIIFMLYPLFALIWQVIKSALSLAIAVFLMTTTNKILGNILGWESILPRAVSLNTYTTSLLVPTFIYLILGLFRNMIVDNGHSIHELYKSFGFDPEDIAGAHLYYVPLLRFIGRSLVFAIFFKLMGEVKIGYSLGISLAILFIDLSASVFWMDFSLKYKSKLIDNGFVQGVLIMIIPLLMHIGMVYFAIPTSVFSLSVLAISLILFARAWAYMKNFDSYGRVIEKASRKYELAMEDIEKATDNQIKIKEKNLGKEKVKGRGFKRLNQLFFLRHKRVIRKPILIKTAIFAALSLILSLTFYFKGYDGESLDEITSFILPLIMYLLLKQDNIIRSMYLNCDKGLMPYGFYRENENVLAMYKERFRSLLKIMALPSLVVMASYLSITSFDPRIGLTSKALSLVYIGFLGLFFVNLPLMQYYLLKPLDQEGKKVGKLSNLIDWLIYMAVFFILPRLSDNLSSLAFTGLISAFIIVFIILSQILVLKLAPKTFRIRN